LIEKNLAKCHFPKNIPNNFCYHHATKASGAIGRADFVGKAAHPFADVSALEREIDHLVYDLYGLTEEEIKIVEESGRK